MKKYTLLFAAFIVICFLAASIVDTTVSDDYIRSQVVMLRSSRGSCSGVQIKAISGLTYILSAGHCRGLAVDGSITVVTQDKKSLQRRIVAEDTNSDLLLLEGLPKQDGLSLAASSHSTQSVRTFTHGKGLDTYKTEGVIVMEHAVSVEDLDEAESIEDEILRCNSAPKYEPVCLLTVIETMITAKIVPGSSGGPVVDSCGDLVGIASASNDYFGSMVTLTDIRKFLGNY